MRLSSVVYWSRSAIWSLVLFSGIALLSYHRLAGSEPKEISKSSLLAITHVTVIDATGAPAKHDMTVVIIGDHVVRLAASKHVALAPHTLQIDGTGKFLIPGLWDMHTHVIEMASIYFPVLLANGVTGIRNMHNVSLDAATKLRADVEERRSLGPHMIVSGPLVDGPAAVWPSAFKISSAAEGREAVRTLKAGGADFVKVYSFLPRDAYFAIAEEARRQHLPFAGHVAQTITVSEASQAGQQSIEHLDGVLRACSILGDELEQRFRDAGAKWRNPASAAEGQAAMIEVNQAAIASYDPAKAAQLFSEFVRNGTWQAPTLVTHYTNAYQGEFDIRDNPEIRFVPSSQATRWRSVAAPAGDWTNNARALLKKNMELLHAMKRAGVRVLAGTDVGGAWLVPGDSLHRELALLVDAGLTPMEALQSATRDAAIFLGRSKMEGTIEKGKVADLVLLDANPLENIRNTRRISGVVTRGTYLSRDELDRMLATAEAEAARN